MSLSVNQSYLPNVPYVPTRTSVKLFTNNTMAFLDYIDNSVDNTHLRLILKGRGALVDRSIFPIHFIHLFEKELSEFKSAIDTDTSANNRDFFNLAICNYIDFIYSNFTDFQFFEATVICLVRKCKVHTRLNTPQSSLVLDSFQKYKHLIDENPKLYKLR